MELQKNDICEINILSYSSEGDGIGKLDGFAIFVKGAMVDEVVQIKIIKITKNCAWARLLKIIKASPKRINPNCNIAQACGGCRLRHMDYNEELKFKLQRINDAFERIGKLNYKVQFINKAENIDRYRNKAAFPVSADKNNKINIGLFQERSHNVLDINTCLIQTKQAEEVISIVCKWMKNYQISAYNENNKSGNIRHILVRTNYKNEVLICIVTKNFELDHKEELVKYLLNSNLKICGIQQNINPHNTNVILGKEYKKIYSYDCIIDKVCNLKFKLSIPSFFQVNRLQAEILYNKAIEFSELDQNDYVLDLYCGTGTITQLMAKNSKYAIGIDIVPEAIENAKENSYMNRIQNVEFICSSAEKYTEKIVNSQQIPNLICVDPPRKGLDSKTINSILTIAPEKLLYISCDPATLARDLNIITNSGYKIKKAEAVDMFPRTCHVETITILYKNK